MGLMVQRGEQTEGNDIHIIIMERMFVYTHMHAQTLQKHPNALEIYENILKPKSALGAVLFKFKVW